jgi:phage terminase small subunit
MKTLNKRQDAFVTAYAKDGNATQAAIRAGYSQRSARVTGHRLLTNAALQQRLKEAGQQGLEALIDVATRGKSESARVQAGTVLMDRSWGKVTTPIAVEHKLIKIAIDLTAPPGQGELPPKDMIDFDPAEYLQPDSSA